jgi:histidine triad (HIT) family protein
MGSTCVFCKIISGEMSSRKVFEDDSVLAFHDLNPQAPTHLLVVPKKHVPSLAASSPEDEGILGHLQCVLGRLGRELGLEGGFRVVSNNGRGAGQSVDHLHYHLIGGRRMAWPPG